MPSACWRPHGCVPHSWRWGTPCPTAPTSSLWSRVSLSLLVSFLKNQGRTWRIGTCKQENINSNWWLIRTKPSAFFSCDITFSGWHIYPKACVAFLDKSLLSDSPENPPAFSCSWHSGWTQSNNAGLLSRSRFLESRCESGRFPPCSF